LMTFYLAYNYREMEDGLLVSDTICRSLDWPEVPDHTSLCRAFHNLGVGCLRALQQSMSQKVTLRARTRVGMMP